MKTCLTILAVAFCAILSNSALAQEEDKREFSEIFSFRGYIKDMRTISFTNSDDVTFDHLIHNRLNFRYYLNDHITFGLENRNRIFYGDNVDANPNFGSLFDFDPGVVDMSYLVVDEFSLVFHSIIDRLWMNYNTERINLRIGRQRINWGINLVWNPNDIFNAYSFVDFDYEERPGRDAIRFEYFLDDQSSVETVVALTSEGSRRIGDKSVGATMGFMYKFNKWAYDFQFLLGGNAGPGDDDDLMVGLGWAGNLKNAGFKGEATLFTLVGDYSLPNQSVLSASIGVDYAFANSLYLNGSILYNTKSEIDDDQDGLLAFYRTDLSAKNLMPSEYSLFLQSSYTFSPIVNASLSTIYGADLNLLFVNPVVGISISNNWELSLVGQLAYAPSETDDFVNQGNAIFIRTKWSFSN